LPALLSPIEFLLVLGTAESLEEVLKIAVLLLETPQRGLAVCVEGCIPLLAAGVEPERSTEDLASGRSDARPSPPA
jgi:hypothetical protein